jgi:hypothetical protein
MTPSLDCDVDHINNNCKIIGVNYDLLIISFKIEIPFHYIFSSIARSLTVMVTGSAIEKQLARSNISSAAPKLAVVINIRSAKAESGIIEYCSIKLTTSVT